MAYITSSKTLKISRYGRTVPAGKRKSHMTVGGSTYMRVLSRATPDERRRILARVSRAERKFGIKIPKEVKLGSTESRKIARLRAGPRKKRITKEEKKKFKRAVKKTVKKAERKRCPVGCNKKVAKKPKRKLGRPKKM